MVHRVFLKQQHPHHSCFFLKRELPEIHTNYTYNLYNPQPTSHFPKKCFADKNKCRKFASFSCGGSTLCRDNAGNLYIIKAFT